MPGSQALQRGDDPAGQPGTDGVVPVPVLQGDDADLADYACQDDITGVILGPGACGGWLPGGLLTLPVAAAGGQSQVGPGHRILARADDGVQQPELMHQLLAGQGAFQMAPQHLRQDVECSLSLGQVNARGVTVRRDLLRRPDDRLGAARVHAAQDEAEQLPHVAAALVRDR